MANSDVDIVNLAYAKLGSETALVSLSDDRKEARIAKRLYQQNLDAVLRSGNWRFAIKRITLAPSSVTVAPDPYGRKYFPLPSDFIFALGTASWTSLGWSIEGRNILASGSAFNLRYIARITDVTQFDPLFIDAFACKLAMELAYPTTQNGSIVASMNTLYDTALRYARHRGAIETSPETVQSNFYDNARFGGRYPGYYGRY
jgi:hypothetical protein